MFDTAAPNASATLALIEALGAAVVLLDAQGVAQALSPAMRALMPGLETGKPLTLVLRDPDLIEAIDQVARMGGRQIVELVERVPVERTFRIHIAALQGSGWRRAVLLTFEDLSEQRVTERMRVDFVANASHELRTPLASLLGFVETLQGPARNDAGARDRFLAIMREQGLRMARLVDDLLSLSRIELRAHLAPDTPVDLAGISREIVDSLTLMARERDVTLKLEIPPDAGRGRGRPRRTAAADGEPRRERHQIRQAGRRGRDRGRGRRRARPASASATTGRASRPSTCRA